MSPADLQLLETRKFSVQDLARWLGVPSVLVNDTQETTALGSSVEQIIEGFYKLKLRPLLTMLEQAIEKRILTVEQRSKGMFVKFNMAALLRANLKDRMEVAAKAVQNGLKTRNECRAYEDDDPIDGADELTAQSNLLPLHRLGEQTTTGGSVPPDTVRQ
jgi:HK97 family phage portal protein